jgi:hypothetical protein
MPMTGNVVLATVMFDGKIVPGRKLRTEVDTV